MLISVYGKEEDVAYFYTLQTEYNIRAIEKMQNRTKKALSKIISMENNKHIKLYEILNTDFITREAILKCQRVKNTFTLKDIEEDLYGGNYR